MVSAQCEYTAAHQEHTILAERIYCRTTSFNRNYGRGDMFALKNHELSGSVAIEIKTSELSPVFLVVINSRKRPFIALDPPGEEQHCEQCEQD